MAPTMCQGTISLFTMKELTLPNIQHDSVVVHQHTFYKLKSGTETLSRIGNVGQSKSWYLKRDLESKGIPMSFKITASVIFMKQ